MRKLRWRHLDTIPREAAGPWRIGGEDNAAIYVLDMNGVHVATIWKMPSRSDSTLEVIQALMVRMGDEVLVRLLCANPESKRPFDARSRTPRHCSTVCSLAEPAACHQGPQARFARVRTALAEVHMERTRRAQRPPRWLARVP